MEFVLCETVNGQVLLTRLDKLRNSTNSILHTVLVIFVFLCIIKDHAMKMYESCGKDSLSFISKLGTCL
jgi:hypothetical protein